MTHRDDAKAHLGMADGAAMVSDHRGAEASHQAALTHALLEIGEQLRIANLIALWRGSAVKNEYASEGEHGLFDTRGKLRPHIAEVLRLDGDPQ